MESKTYKTIAKGASEKESLLEGHSEQGWDLSPRLPSAVCDPRQLSWVECPLSTNGSNTAGCPNQSGSSRKALKWAVFWNSQGEVWAETDGEQAFQARWG